MAFRLLLPTKETSGTNEVWLLAPLLNVVKTPAEGARPLTVHANVKLSVSASAPLAVKFEDPPTATVFPVAFGVCEEHCGGVFLVTVQLLVVVLVPLDSVAVSVFAPVLKADEVRFKKFAVEPKA